MKPTFLAALGLALATALIPLHADAKRLGGGKSLGMQRNMPERTAPAAPPPKPAAPAQQGAAGQQGSPAQQAAPGAAPNAAAAQAAAPKRSWMGPLAGLAAGLGLAALMSHLGLGAGFANFLLIALLALAAFVVVRMVMARRTSAQAAGIGTRGVAAGSAAQVAWPQGGGQDRMQGGTQGDAQGDAQRDAQADAQAGRPAATAASADAPAEPFAASDAGGAAAPVARAFVPAVFDGEGFARTAKTIFIRLQAANDSRDLDDLRSFTTPEMFAELSLDIQERNGGAQHTEVLGVESLVLDVAEEGARQIVSVRMRGQVREQALAQPVAVDEVWHLVKPTDGSRNWAIAGIEQWQGSAVH